MATPFPSASQAPLESASTWIASTLLGDLAIGICALAVAAIGLTMLTGRLPIRDGMRVLIGCFVLLGAPIIASSFSAAWTNVAAPDPQTIVIAPTQEPDPRADLPPAQYDPYAGASLRQD